MLAFGVLTVVPLLSRAGPDWSTASVLLFAAIGMAVATVFVARGSRLAAGVLLGGFVLTKLASWGLAGEPV